MQKKYKEKVKEYLKTAGSKFAIITEYVTSKRIETVKIRYQKHIKKLKKEINNRKIRVLFYVTENQKWGYQSLYEIFEKDVRFEPVVVVGLLYGVHKGKDTTRQNLEENYQFFKTKNMNVEYGYKNKKYINLKEFKPDIVFYEQPWGLPPSHKPWDVAKYALTAYSPYAYQIFKNISNTYTKIACYLYKYYLTHELNYIRLKKDYNNIDHGLVVGYPKLDTYLMQTKDNNDKAWKNPEKIKIIYAPHHSFNDSSLKLATFRDNGKIILEWAKSHPETTWVFKPHPQFKFALLKNNIMTEEEIDRYYQEWNAIGNIYTQGDYFDIFKTSDLMITDCGSFLAEYLPTKKPLIRPINSDAIELNEIGQLLTSEYYQTKNNQELLNILEEVIVKRNDYKENDRIKLASEIFDFEENAASKIYREFLKDFGLKEVNND